MKEFIGYKNINGCDVYVLFKAEDEISAWKKLKEAADKSSRFTDFSADVERLEHMKSIGRDTAAYEEDVLRRLEEVDYEWAIFACILAGEFVQESSLKEVRHLINDAGLALMEPVCRPVVFKAPPVSCDKNEQLREELLAARRLRMNAKPQAILQALFARLLFKFVGGGGYVFHHEGNEITIKPPRIHRDGATMDIECCGESIGLMVYHDSGRISITETFSNGKTRAIIGEEVKAVERIFFNGG